MCRDIDQAEDVLVPDFLKLDVLGHVHGSPTTGHSGVARTCKREHERFWWPGLRADASEFVAKHLPCKMYRATKPPKRGRLNVYHPCRRFEIVTVGILEIFPRSRSGNVKVVDIGDTCTRFVWAYQVKDERAETIAFVLLDGWIFSHGPPEKLSSDRGKAFAGKLLT